MNVEYDVMIPSRGRAERLDSVRRLFPQAIFVVDEREADVYLPVVGDSALRTHPSLQGLGRILGECVRLARTQYLVLCDDDVEALEPNVGSRRTSLMDAGSVSMVVSGMVAVLMDLGLPLGGWPNATRAFSVAKHHVAKQPFSLLGIPRGLVVTSKDVKYDPALTISADVDAAAGVLAQWGEIVIDRRFAVRSPILGTHKGGCQDFNRQAVNDMDMAYLKRKWPGLVQVHGRKDTGRTQAALTLRTWIRKLSG